MDYERLVAQHKNAVYLQMVRACGNHDDAEDALVEALLAAHRSLPQIQDEGAFRAWLAIVGRRVCGRIKRRAALQPVLSLSGIDEEQLPRLDPASNAQVAAEMQEMVGRIRQALDELPKPLRDVYIMREIEGRSASETATALHLTQAAVKSRLHRSRDAVRRSLDGSLNKI